MKHIFYVFFLSIIFSQNEYLVTIPATSYTDWVYYSFESHSVVEIENPETSLDWDIAMQRKHIRANSGLAGIGNGGGYVDSTKTWIDHWSTMDFIPEDLAWHTDDIFYDFYDITTHTMGEGIENPALRAWGWFDNYFQLIPTNYVMFIKCANGQDVVKFWAYDYYANGSGNIAVRYQTGFNNLSSDIYDSFSFSISNAYPNPFNPSTNFDISIPETKYLEVNVFDLNGSKVENIFKGIANSGKHNFTWNAQDMNSGVYFIRAEFSNQIQTKKLMLVK